MIAAVILHLFAFKVLSRTRVDQRLIQNWLKIEMMGVAKEMTRWSGEKQKKNFGDDHR